MREPTQTRGSGAASSARQDGSTNPGRTVRIIAVPRQRQPDPAPDPALVPATMDVVQAATYLGSPRQRSTRGAPPSRFGPRAVKAGGALRYRRCDLDVWIEEHAEAPDQSRRSMTTSASRRLPRLGQPKARRRGACVLPTCTRVAHRPSGRAMARPPLPIGTFGAITTTEVRPGVYLARTRFRDVDGVTRAIKATGRSAAAATRELKSRSLTGAHRRAG